MNLNCEQQQTVNQMVMSFKNTRGSNTKLGDSVYHWSLTEGETCLGSTSICRLGCYIAPLTAFRTKMAQSYARNFKLALRPDFEKLLIAALGQLQPALFRIHVSGDFFSVKYFRTWKKALAENPHLKPFAFTRSWRVNKIRAEAEKDYQPWLHASTDPETGPPPTGWRQASMSTVLAKEINPNKPTPFLCNEMYISEQTCAKCGRCPGFREKDGMLVPLAPRLLDRPVSFALHGRYAVKTQQAMQLYQLERKIA